MGLPRSERDGAADAEVERYWLPSRLVSLHERGASAAAPLFVGLGVARLRPQSESGRGVSSARRWGTARRLLDSYASLLILLLANFFLLEIVDDPRWDVIGSTLLAAVALVVAISDPDAGQKLNRRQALTVLACVLIAPVVLFVNSRSLVGLTYLLPVALLVTATLPVTLVRVLRHRKVTHETVFGALCTYVLVGLLFAFLFLAVADLRDGPFSRSRARISSRSTSTSVSSADDARLRRPLSGCRASPGARCTGGAPRPGFPRHARRPPRDPLGPAERRRYPPPGKV